MFRQNIKQYIRPGYNNQVNSITFLSPMNDQIDRNYYEKKPTTIKITLTISSPSIFSKEVNTDGI